MKIKYFILIIITALVASCDLEQLPQDTASKNAVFGSEMD